MRSLVLLATAHRALGLSPLRVSIAPGFSGGYNENPFPSSRTLYSLIPFIDSWPQSRAGKWQSIPVLATFTKFVINSGGMCLAWVVHGLPSL